MIYHKTPQIVRILGIQYMRDMAISQKCFQTKFENAVLKKVFIQLDQLVSQMQAG